jgi:hypothetical protein
VLPEITPRPIPGRFAIGFHLVDYVVHGWDVARTLGIAYELPPDVLAAALPIAEAVPAGDARLAPGAAFAPPLTDPVKIRWIASSPCSDAIRPGMSYRAATVPDHESASSAVAGHDHALRDPCR